MNFQELIDAYTVRLDEYFKKIDKACHSKKKQKEQELPKSPNYIYEVIMPIYDSLAEIMRWNPKIKIPNPESYYPVKGFYKIKVGIITVGGFSVPNGDDYSVYFTPLRYASPLGDRVKVENTEHLRQLIMNQIKKIKNV